MSGMGCTASDGNVTAVLLCFCAQKPAKVTLSLCTVQASGHHTMPRTIQYSEKYQDDIYEYRYDDATRLFCGLNSAGFVLTATRRG
jgi:hypothetical protein